MNYQYPFEESWSTDEIVEVIHFFNLVEKAYEASVNRNEFLEAYRKFKEIVPSISEEKIYFSEFEKTSSYSSYHVVKEARESNENTIKMNKHKC